MKTIYQRMTLAVAAAVLLAAALPVSAQSDEAMTTLKVVEMTKAGLSSETIINAIISSGAVFNLTADEIVSLKEQGVDEDVINFMLRTRPLNTEEEQAAPPADQPQAVEPGQPGQPGDATVPQGETYQGEPYYSGQSYFDDSDPYIYTDGYNYENERSSTIVYHYYGPWFRAYPYYYGFYYYPASYYYWCYWPDDYYYYFYYPRFSTWRYYYYYPRYSWGRDYYVYSGGRYIHAKGGRYIDRTTRRGSTRYRTAVPRSGVTSTRVRGTDGYYDGRSAVRTRDTGYRTRSGVSRSSVTRDVTKRYRSGTVQPRSPVYRAPSQTRSRSTVKPRTSDYRSRSGVKRSSGRSYSSPSRSSRSKSSTVRSSRSRSSSSAKSSSSRSSSRSKSSSSRSARRK